jgi:hypothetical protein
MTPDAALIELLKRVGARRGTLFISDQELNTWPSIAVVAMKSQGLITKTRVAKSALCPGCERQCVMPVRILTETNCSDAFIICDKRSDINRVMISIDQLEQWQVSGFLIAELLARLPAVYLRYLAPGRHFLAYK